MKLYKLFMLVMLFTVTSICFATDGRYRSNEVTPAVVPEPNNESSGGKNCQCDPASDPCCVPPLGGSSTETKKPNNVNSDVANCKCDPNVDPCCKRMPGTKNTQ